MPLKEDIRRESEEIWVFVEYSNERLATVSLELLGEGRRLSSTYGAKVAAIILGEDPKDQAQELIEYGADTVILAGHPALKDYRTELYTTIIVDQCRREKPGILLVGATCIGKDLAPRVAARLRTGCLADCTELNLEKDEGLLVASKPYFGRNVMADIICPLHRPQIVTVKPGLMDLPQKDENRKGKVIRADIAVKEEDDRVTVLDIVQSDSGEGALDQAEKIVAVGMGAGNAEGVALVQELADLLGAELGATTLPIDQGWISPDRKIGQTGKTVRPRLYIGCGISGAIQHAAGMINAELIVAINKDPKAEIFGFADYGIVGDLHQVVPALINELKKMQG